MSKLLGTEDGYEIHLGQKNPSCYPCCWEGSVSACRSDLCTKYLEWLGIFEGAEYLPNIIQVLDSLPMKPETPWYDVQTACETAIRQQFRGGDVCAVLG